MGMIHPEVTNGYLARDPRERPTLEFFLTDFDVTWGGYETGFGTSASAFFLKPTRDMSQLFGLSDEILLLHSNHSTLQARSLQLAERILSKPPASGRVDPLIIVLVSPDLALESRIARLMADNRQSQIAIPFRDRECLDLRDSQFLRRRFREHLFTRDLFDVTQPIMSDLYFFGRRSIVVDLRDSIRNGENTGLFGLRKTGKTSILFRLDRLLKKDGRGRLVYLDLQDARLYTLRWWELLEVMRKHLLGNDRLTLAAPEAAPAAFRDAATQFARRHSGEKLVFALDEIEHITPGLSMRPHWQTDFLDFWKTLRAIQNEHRHLCFVVSGVNASCVEKPTYGGHDNPLFSLVKVRYMPPFEQDDIANMASTLGRPMGMHFSDAAITYLRNTFGGHPLLTRMACSFVHRTTPESERPVAVTTEVLLREAEECNRKLWPLGNHVLGVLHDWYPQELHMLESLAKGDVKSFEEFASALPQCVEHLRAYHLIAEKPTRMTIPFLAEFLKKANASINIAEAGNSAVKQEELSLDDLITVSTLRNRIEPKLRRYIKRVLKAHLGPEKWISPILKVVPTPDRERLEGIEADTILNERLFLVTLLRVVEQNWDAYFKSLEATIPAARVTKLNFTVLLDFVNAHREDAHAKPISEADLATLRIAVSAIEKAVDRFLAD